MDFVDSHVWRYALVRGADPVKRKAAAAVVSGGARVVSSQVVNEVCMNLILSLENSRTRVEVPVGS